MYHNTLLRCLKPHDLADPKELSIYGKLDLLTK